jgi:hypothetical protein
VFDTKPDVVEMRDDPFDRPTGHASWARSDPLFGAVLELVQNRR